MKDYVDPIKNLYLPFLVQQKVKINGKWSIWMDVNRYQTIHEADENIPQHDFTIEKWRIRFIVERIAVERLSEDEEEWITYYTEILNENNFCNDCEMYPMGEYCVDCKYYISPPF